MAHAMTKPFALAVVVFAAAFALAGCPKRVESHTVSGTDEEKLDQYSARLEELRTRMQAENPACEDLCSTAKEVCEIQKSVCEITARLPDRADRCVAANEDCARFNDSCASCSGR